MWQRISASITRLMMRSKTPDALDWYFSALLSKPVSAPSSG
jgi:hypothetical protein